MRHLGKGHSVTFFAPGPREVDHSIRSLMPGGMAPSNRVGVLDVVRWAIHETCEDICHSLPYWAQQGLKASTTRSASRHTGNIEQVRI